MLPLRKYVDVLKQYLVPYKKLLIILSGLIIFEILIIIVNPQIIAFYIDEVTVGTTFQRLAQAAMLFIGLAIIQQVLTVINVYVSQTLAWNSTNSLRMDLYSHTINLDMTFQNEYKPGEMIERIDGDVIQLANFFSAMSVQLITNSLLIIGILIAIFIKDFMIGLIFTGFVAVSLLLMYFVRDWAIPYWKKARETSQEVLGFIEERISGTEDIVANGGIDFTMSKFYENSNNEYRAFTKAVLLSRVITVAIFFIQGLGLTLVFVLGIPAYTSGKFTLGELFLLHSYLGLLFGPIFTIMRQIQDLQMADASLDRISELFAIESKLEDRGKKNIETDIKNMGMKFDNVSFSYVENELVLNDISFDLEPNTTLGLIGRTGSGKSTISRLIFRLYDIENGNIQFYSNGNSLNITDIPIKHLRQNIAMVTQSVELFEATLRDNLTFFDDSTDDQMLLDILDDMGLTGWYNNLEKGLDTIIMDGSMSAGEAQLLAFSRIFLRDPKIVILDEATSRLDPATEGLIEKAVEKLLENRTAILIAHRLETLSKLDNIMILDSGSITEFGNQQELLNDPKSEYSRLLKLGIEEVLI